MARRGRKPKSKDQKLADALRRSEPADYILARRKLFAGIVLPPQEKRIEGRNGEIDSEICDAIGQLCALGLFDGHGHDPIEMRDKGRFWGGFYAQLMGKLGEGSTGFEPNFRAPGRRSASYVGSGPYTGADMLFDRIDEALWRTYVVDGVTYRCETKSRQALRALVVEPLIGHHETVPWAQSLIDEALLKRGRMVPHRVVRFPDESDRAYLEAAIRGLCVLIDGSLPARFERAA